MISHALKNLVFINRNSAAVVEGNCTLSKKRTRFFHNKRILTDFCGFFLKIKEFLPKVYELRDFFGSEMPLGGCHRWDGR